jgi:hypothetical protein
MDFLVKQAKAQALETQFKVSGSFDGDPFDAFIPEEHISLRANIS